MNTSISPPKKKKTRTIRMRGPIAMLAANQSATDAYASGHSRNTYTNRTGYRRKIRVWNSPLATSEVRGEKHAALGPSLLGRKDEGICGTQSRKSRSYRRKKSVLIPDRCPFRSGPATGTREGGKRPRRRDPAGGRTRGRRRLDSLEAGREDFFLVSWLVRVPELCSLGERKEMNWGKLVFTGARWEEGTEKAGSGNGRILLGRCLDGDFRKVPLGGPMTKQRAVWAGPGYVSDLC